MKKYSGILIIANLVIILIYFNYTVFQKERVIEKGQLVLLELAPVDPRSLMQGDYMRLNYAIGGELTEEIMDKQGYCVVKLDERGVAKRLRFQKNRKPIEEGELLMEYYSPDYLTINIGAESFFFQEGDAEKYEKAKYGGFKIDPKGNSILVGLYDENLKKIE